MAKLHFQHHYYSHQRHMIFKANFLLKKHFLLHQCWKQLCCLILY